MQTITMRETGEVFNIEDMVYPLPELGIIYLRMVVVDCEETPTHFLIAQPSDILYRKMDYDQELMDEIIEASDNMRQAHMEMMEAAVTEEKVAEEVEEDTEHHAFYR